MIFGDESADNPWICLKTGKCVALSYFHYLIWCLVNYIGCSCSIIPNSYYTNPLNKLFSLYCSKFLDLFLHHNSLVSSMLFPVTKGFKVVCFLLLFFKAREAGQWYVGMFRNATSFLYTHTHSQALGKKLPNYLKSSNHPFWLLFPPLEARPALELHCLLNSPLFLTQSLAGVTAPHTPGGSGPLLPEHTHCLAKQREEAGWPLRHQPQSFWDTRVSPSYKLHPVYSQTGPTTRLYLWKGNLPQRVHVGAEECGGGERCNRKANRQRVKIQPIKIS